MQNYKIINNQDKSIFGLIIELFKSKYVLALFVIRDLKILYRQTIIGPAWYIINPIVTSGVFTIIFSNILKINNNSDNNFIFYLTGITIWNFFSININKLGTYYLTNGKLLKRIYIPTLVIPFSVLIVNFCNFILQFFLLLILILIFQIKISIIKLLLIIFPIFLIILISLGLGFILNSFTYKYHDIRQIIPYFLGVFIFLCPVIYDYSLIPENYKLIFVLNPVFVSIEMYRSFIFNTPLSVDLIYIFITIVTSILFFIYGLFRMKKTEKYFIDYL